MPVRNEAGRLSETVAAMLAQRLDEVGELEVVLVDDHSTDDTLVLAARLAAADERVVVLANPGHGTAGALNACLAVARGEYVARMDAHALFPADYLSLGIARLRRRDVAWVAGPQRPEGRTVVSRAVEAALGTWLGRGGSRKWSADGGESDLDTGVFCGVWRREEVVRHGGWDEGWPRNQDSELAARFLRSGERIVSLPAMAARYEPRGSLGGLWRQYHGYGLYRCRTAVRHPTSLRRSALLPPLIVLAALSALAAPRLVRRPARLSLGVYGIALLRAAAQARHAPAPVAARVPLVLAVMHMAHGTGFLRGTFRWGVPWRAVLRLAGIRRAVDERPYEGPITAPSLSGEPERSA